MHPNTKPTITTLVLCMVILGILLLPLPFTAYKVLKFFLSIGLLYTAGFFLRPCKNLSFQPSAGQIESGTRDPADGSFSGTLEDSRTGQRLAELDDENSQLLQYVKREDRYTPANPLPTISLQLTLGLVIAAVVMFPFSQIHLPRTAWMFLDVLVIAMLGWALHLIREENAGNRPHVSLTGTIGQPPKVDFLPIMDVFRRVGRLWPAIIGVAFAIGLLGAKSGDGDFEDFSLLHTIGQTIYALFGAAIVAWMIYYILDCVSRSGTKEQGRSEQAPGELFVTVFALIYLCMAFGGYFSPVPEDEGRYDDYSEPWE
jgi:hypothetical protein